MYGLTRKRFIERLLEVRKDSLGGGCPKDRRNHEPISMFVLRNVALLVWFLVSDGVKLDAELSQKMRAEQDAITTHS